MNKISEVTRRNIFKFIANKKIIWNGKLDEVEFLSRLYDLKNLPSEDRRFKNAFSDIFQHRINNYDGNDDWVFYDKRFNLMYCPDEEFIKFLCEIVHPVVRDNNESAQLISMFNSELNNDGYEIYVGEKISGQNKYSGRLLMNDIEEVKRVAGYISLALHRIKKHICQNTVGDIFDESENIYSGFEYENILSKYTKIENDDLREIFTLCHFHLNNLFKYLNDRIKFSSSNVHAHQSRELIFFIQTIKDVQKNLCRTKFSFDINKNYNEKMDLYFSFLQPSYGSPIPENTDCIEIVELDPIFLLKDSISIESSGKTYRVNLDFVGRGSYAEVYRFFDPFYGRPFALKRANIDLDDKELCRFRKEFDVLKELSSPYIVDVYCYSDERNEYIMEYMDITLFDYIINHNPDFLERKSIIKQALRGYSYMHIKNYFHRDISPNNVLIKKYEDVNVVKISDYGLVKIPESDLTSINSVRKGYLNDPGLSYTGFKNYELRHETYAITRLIYFILTGSFDTENISCKFMRQFIEKGINADINSRFQNISEIEKSLNNLFKNISSGTVIK